MTLQIKTYTFSPNFKMQTTQNITAYQEENALPIQFEISPHAADLKWPCYNSV